MLVDTLYSSFHVSHKQSNILHEASLKEFLAADDALPSGKVSFGDLLFPHRLQSMGT